MADFNFYLNRQGIQGRKGDKGDTGFTPTISVSEQTLNSYKLKITNEYNEFETPNLIGNLGVTDNGGTYLRYDPATGTVSTGEIDGATTEVVGGVRKSTDADLTNLSADTTVTPANVADMLPLLLEAGTDNVTITHDEATSKTKISVEDGGATIDDSTTSTMSVWSSSKTNTEITTVANEVDSLTDEVTDLTDRVTANEADISAMKTNKQNKLIAGDNINIDENTNTISSTASPYELPIATTAILGGVKPDGKTITITNDGTISSVDDGGATIDDSTTSTTSVWSSSKTNTEITTVDNKVVQVQSDVDSLNGSVYVLKNDVITLNSNISGLNTDIQRLKTNKQNKLIAGDNINIDENTNIISSTASSYELPVATTTTLGGIKPDGETTVVNPNGIISAIGAVASFVDGGNSLSNEGVGGDNIANVIAVQPMQTGDNATSIASNIQTSDVNISVSAKEYTA